MQAWESSIIRVSTGLLNTVNDTVIANQSGITGQSKFGGQLGKLLAVSQEQIGLMFSAAVGTLYGGVYQYVKLATDLGTPAPEVGQMLFWDTSAGIGSFVVTDTKDETNTPTPAGVYIGGPDAGNYGFIFKAGLCYLLFGALTAGAATGQGIVVTAAGLADNNTPVNPIYVGWAYDLPVALSLKRVNVDFMTLRS